MAPEKSPESIPQIDGLSEPLLSRKRSMRTSNSKETKSMRAYREGLKEFDWFNLNKLPSLRNFKIS